MDAACLYLPGISDDPGELHQQTQKHYPHTDNPPSVGSSYTQYEYDLGSSARDSPRRSFFPHKCSSWLLWRKTTQGILIVIFASSFADSLKVGGISCFSVGTLTKSNLWKKAFIWLMFPGHNSSRREVGAGTWSGTHRGALHAGFLLDSPLGSFGCSLGLIV